MGSLSGVPAGDAARAIEGRSIRVQLDWWNFNCRTASSRSYRKKKRNSVVKTERRHELKENDLMHALGAAREFLDLRGKQIGVAVLVVGAIVVGTAMTVRARSAAIETKWRQKSELRFDNPEVGRESLEALAGMTRDVTDDRFVFVSMLHQGQQALRLAGTVEFPPDEDFNNKAKAAFEELLDRFPRRAFAVGVAHLGLATVAENEYVLDGDPSHKDTARKHLEAVSTDTLVSGMPFQRMAMERLAIIDAVFTPMTFAPSEPDDEGDNAVEGETLVIPTPTDALTDPADVLTDPADAPTDRAEGTDDAASGSTATPETPANDAEPADYDPPTDGGGD